MDVLNKSKGDGFISSFFKPYLYFFGFSRIYLNHLISFQSELNTKSNVVSVKRFLNLVLEGFSNFDLTTEL